MIPVNSATTEVEMKKLHSNLQEYLDKRKQKEIKRKDMIWRRAYSFVVLEVILRIVLFFYLDNPLAICVTMATVSFPILCLFGIVLKDYRFWWPQLISNFFLMMGSEILFAIIIVRTVKDWNDLSHRDENLKSVLCSTVVMGFLHFMAYTTTKAYAQVSERLGQEQLSTEGNNIYGALKA